VYPHIGTKSCYRLSANEIGFIREGSYESDILSFSIGAEMLASQNWMNGGTIPGKHCVTQQPPRQTKRSP
jgi:hypothetical protein